ncbi:MAG: hypothetical protein GY820_31755, partial [Gammaproteobacteria bacterium]|nr:hypothetical protein [Gammaproteobacteria bacterium]
TTENALSAAQSQQWIIDSGASSHMTAIWDAIEDYRVFEQPKSVRLGDGRVLPALGSGHVTLVLESTTTSSGEPSDITLMNVLYVPKLRCSLISVRAVLERGKSVLFADNKCWIKTMNGKTIATGKRVDRLFLLNLHGQESAAVASSQATTSFQTWHQ